jgi:regulator of protease activity HflC (stomatin/prohibitin superfamily)
MTQRPPSQESQARPLSGYLMFVVFLALVAGSVAAFVQIGAHENRAERVLPWALTGLGGLLASVLCMPGFFVVAPNMARVLVLFGRYRGTVRVPGWWWTNPFTSKGKLSLRAQNLNGQQLKVNDLAGNPIEIAAVVVWRVADTAQASFDVEKVDHYVQVQSESALRHLASRHPYDDGQVLDVATSLRGSAEEVSKELQAELAERLGRAGVEVLEARLSHLAYAPEIAGAMLQRQQAAAVIAARRRIVEGAVGMVEHALEMLAEKKVVDLDPERRAAMVGNLLVVLCSHSNPAPVLNTGSLYG